MKKTDSTGHYSKWTDWPYLNRSRCPTSYRSGVIDPSLENCDSPIQKEPTLPSLGQPPMKGAPLEVDPTLDFGPSSNFSQGARPLACLGFSGAKVFLEVFSLFFPATPTPPTSSNSFPSYPTLNLTSPMKKLQRSPQWHFSNGVPDPLPVLDSAEPVLF